MKPKRIVIHCSATGPQMNFTGEDIRQWHTSPKPQGRGWSRPGYHYVIERNPVKISDLVKLDTDSELSYPEIANGVKGYNRDSIHICYIGGLDRTLKKPENNLTEGQAAELFELIFTILSKFESITSVIGHNDLNPMKACPSFNVYEWLKKMVTSPPPNTRSYVNLVSRRCKIG